MSFSPLKNKNIAIFLDGTWNDYQDNTNVWRMKLLCNNDLSQVTFYSKGVGTDTGEKYTGGGLGYGINDNVIEAYEWLIEHYEENDRIFIFGFSRGAYTARSLSGLISKSGLLHRGAPLSVREVYNRYRLNDSARSIRRLKNDHAEGKTEGYTQQEHWMVKYCYAAPIWFIGVWDTVGALGIPLGAIQDISTKSFGFLETDLRINNKYAFHALAIDEHREKFSPTLWTKPESSKYDPRSINEVEQRWFTGAHANVGGGYTGDLLAQRPLQWIMDKAKQHGLTFREEVSIDGDFLTAPIIDSYGDFLKGMAKYNPFSKRFYRPIGFSPIPSGKLAGSTTINETIDHTVFERWHADKTYRPPNLVEWAQRYGVKVDDFLNSVRADYPSEVVSDEPTTMPISDTRDKVG